MKYTLKIQKNVSANSRLIYLRKKTKTKKLIFKTTSSEYLKHCGHWLHTRCTSHSQNSSDCSGVGPDVVRTNFTKSLSLVISALLPVIFWTTLAITCQIMAGVHFLRNLRNSVSITSSVLFYSNFYGPWVWNKRWWWWWWLHL